MGIGIGDPRMIDTIPSDNRIAAAMSLISDHLPVVELSRHPAGGLIVLLTGKPKVMPVPEGACGITPKYLHLWSYACWKAGLLSYPGGYQSRNIGKVSGFRE